MISKYQNCKMLTCTVETGFFNKGETYPFYHINGYAYLCMLDIFSKKPVLFALDFYEDGTFKIVGTWDGQENAVFKEVT